MTSVSFCLADVCDFLVVVEFATALTVPLLAVVDVWLAGVELVLVPCATWFVVALVDSSKIAVLLEALACASTSKP